ncbi:MAG TPA: phosphopyruvate hydratase [Kofleriaceae bacterium]|jgi:enolase
MSDFTISTLNAREILDSRGNPTIEVDVTFGDGSFGRAAVPSGASTGSREAVELRDGDKSRFGGKGVLVAIANVHGKIAPALRGVHGPNQSAIDHKLIELDGTENKSKLGANAILGVSLAIARASAASVHEPLYHWLARGQQPLLPVPMFNVLNGGAHADNSVDFQEFMIAPVGAPSFREALRMAAETYQALKALLKKRGMSTSIGDEGGFAPHLRADVQALEVIVEAIEAAGLRPGKDIVIALDPAASELYENGRYEFKKSGAPARTSAQMVELYETWVRTFPIWSIEDGLAEDDWDGWKLLTQRLGATVQIVGDDIFVTNPKIIARAIREKVANASLIKLNQIGTVTETLEAIAMSHAAGYGTVISHRSGETSDDFIADLAVGSRAAQIKSGAPARGERVAKYNQLARIEDELGRDAVFAGKAFVAAGGFRRT